MWSALTGSFLKDEIITAGYRVSLHNDMLEKCPKAHVFKDLYSLILEFCRDEAQGMIKFDPRKKTGFTFYQFSLENHP